MFDGQRAVRRLAITIAALIVLTAAPVSASAGMDSRSAFATLGHAWLTVDSNLRAPSHISAWAIDEYLARATPLPPLGHAFKRAEAKYGVNALYLVAHAMHETGFGTSYIGQRYRNLFGWNAYDRDPTGLATRFTSFAASVDYVAGQISEHYLTPSGKYYGGAPTLRGMHRYASDPLWANLIARLANGIVLSTLSRQGVAFGRPVIGDVASGQTALVTAATKKGSLPDGLEVAYRFVPIAIVEAGAPTGSVPPADPPFRLGKGESSKGAFGLTITPPRRAGRYRLELEVRDSDGSPLTEYGVPKIPAVTVRVVGSDAVAFELDQDADALAVTMTNTGRQTIPISGPVPGSGAQAAPSAIPSALTASLVADDGTIVLLAKVLLDVALHPGDSWTARLPLPDPTVLPGVLLLRMEIGDAPRRLSGTPPGVFRLGVSARTGSQVAVPSPVALSAPAALGTHNPTAAAQPSVLSITPVTPVDAATRLLLDPEWQPAAPTAADLTTSRTAAPAPEAKLSYLAIVDPGTPGRATLRITNSGTATFAVNQGAADDVANATMRAPSPTGDPAAPVAGTFLLVSAVPAWGPAGDPVVMLIPLTGDIPAGTTADVQIALPDVARVQLTYLVVARVVPGGDLSPYPPTLFWLRSAPRAHAVVDLPAATPGADPAAGTTGPAVPAASPDAPSSSDDPTIEPAAGSAVGQGAAGA